MKNVYDRYRHAMPLLLYMTVYLIWFFCLEQKVSVSSRYTLIHTAMDDYIPFCEVFVIPYFLWFVYLSAVVVYLFFRDKEEYFRCCFFLFTGMTVFLLVSTLFPNGHDLRPAVMPRDNLFTSMVASLYRTDTPTNLWPSIHVFNSIGAHIAVTRTAGLRDRRLLRASSFVLCSSIILSTVFIKQHSMFDVITAFLMAAALYVLVYRLDIVMSLRTVKNRRKRPQVNS